MPDAIGVFGLSKTFGAVRALDDVTFTVQAGSVGALLGPNGSGKTTTIQAIVGFLNPSAGTIHIEGRPLVPAAFEELAYVPESSALFDKMTIAEHLIMQRRAFRSFDRERAAALTELFSLDPKRRVCTLSKGQRNAVALVLAFARRPRIVILDEPTDGLDPILQRTVLDLLIDAASTGAAILLSSHQIGLIERAADRVVILQRGTVRVCDDVDALKARRCSVAAVFREPFPMPNGLSSLPGVVAVEGRGTTLTVGIEGDPANVLAALEALAPLDLRVTTLDLEEIFLQTVRPNGAGGGIPS